MRNKSDALKDFIKIVNKLAKYAKEKKIILLIQKYYLMLLNMHQICMGLLETL